MKKINDAFHLGYTYYGGLECEVVQVIYNNGDIDFEMNPVIGINDYYFDRCVPF